MARSFLISFLSFPFSALAFIIGWTGWDLRTGALAAAIVFSVFFAAAMINLFFVRRFTYLDAVLPVVFAGVWSLALAPFSFGASLFSAPFFIGAAVLLGACIAVTARWDTPKGWLTLPALVFLYEMLPINIPGPVDDTFSLTASLGAVGALFFKRVLPEITRSRPKR
jgi:hypothetical protein